MLKNCSMELDISQLSLLKNGEIMMCVPIFVCFCLAFELLDDTLYRRYVLRIQLSGVFRLVLTSDVDSNL
jgi:hypothetical protein